MDTEVGNRSLHEDLKWASVRGFLSLDKLHVHKISKQDCWTTVRKAWLAWKDVSVITKKCNKHIKKIVDGKELPWKRESPQEAADSEVKARTQHRIILAHCPGFSDRTLSTGCVWNAVWTLTALLVRVLQQQGLGYNNNWSNCTKGAALPNATAWTSAPISSPNPLPLCCNWGIPLFYQKSTSPRILDIAAIFPWLFQLPLLHHPTSRCLTHYAVHPTFPQLLPISQHLPSPRHQPSWKHHYNSLTSPPLNWLPFHHSAKTGQVQSHPSVLILQVFWTCIQEAKTEQKSKSTWVKRMSDLQQQKL